MWTPELDAKLLDGVRKYGTSNWQAVALGIHSRIGWSFVMGYQRMFLVLALRPTPTRHPPGAQCFLRFFHTLHPDVEIRPWTESEDK